MTSDPHGVDTEKLATYLEARISGFHGPVSAEKFAGGQSNPTFLLTAASGRYVLRRKPPGQLLKSAHAVDREFTVLRALAGTDVPVARAWHLCEDAGVIGTMFYVMSFVDGRIFWDPSLPELSRDQRGLLFNEIIRVLAAMHEVDVEAVGLGDYGRPGNYFERQLGRWIKQYRASATATIEAMETLIHWLPGHLPADDGQVSLIHGDYRIDNLIFHADEPRILAVLDWELSTLGHPLADLAYFCMCLRLPASGHIAGLGDADRDALGIPGEEQIIERYCTIRNLGRIEHWHFYLAFSFFRLAAICQGVLKRALDGNASSARALEIGSLAGPLALLGSELVEDNG
jgi:aminoglycoside phosphotransferase (APT) family kinase protein